MSEKQTSGAPAGFVPRLLAFTLDYVLIAVYLTLLVGLGLAANRLAPSVWQDLFSGPLRAELTGFALITLPVTLYFALSEASARQATWGKRRLGLRVVGPGLAPLGLGRALARSALKFLPWELAHFTIWQFRFAADPGSPLLTAALILVWVLIGANIASLLLSPTRQTGYDRIAGTRVLRAP